MVFYNKNDTYLTVISQLNMGKMSIFTSVSPDRRPKVNRSIVQTIIFISDVMFRCIYKYILLLDNEIYSINYSKYY